MSPKAVDKKTKRQMIMRAALEVFAEQGTEATKMIDIARRAGVGKGTLYEYFPSKEELIAGSMLMMMDELDARMVERLYPLVDPLDKIRAFIEETFSFFVEKEDRVKILADFYAAGIPRPDSKPLIADIDKRYVELIEWLAVIIDEGVEHKSFRPVDSKQTASILLATIDGLLFQAMLGLMPPDREKVLENILTLFLDGIKA